MGIIPVAVVVVAAEDITTPMRDMVRIIMGSQGYGRSTDGWRVTIST